MEKEKKQYEALDLGKDCIVVPRQAIGKVAIYPAGEVK